MSDNILDAFSKSRAEEYPDDLWNEFVIPPGYQESKCLFKYKRAVMVEGGRGSGKTMFLRYHCHKTRFSSLRQEVSSDELSHIGLYFRPDTDFCAMINKFNFDQEWERVFKHYVFINIIREFYSAIKIISNTRFVDFELSVNPLELETPISLQKLVEGFPSTYKGLYDFSEYLSAQFSFWVNDSDSFEKPPFIEPRTVINSLISGLKDFFPVADGLCFYLYFDEFENLSHEQQKIVNTWMKHGQTPLIFNAAYKKGAKVSRETASSERLVLRNDYRIVDLEDITSQEFKIFSAEVLCLKLMEKTEFDQFGEVKRCLSDERFLGVRLSDDYQDAVLTAARRFLPDITYKDIAASILETGTLRKRIERFLIQPSLVESDYHVSDFIHSDYPEESIINGLLLNRKNYTPSNVFEMFSRLRSGDLSSYKGLIEQNLVGAILWVYLSASWKKCPIYAGFERFCLLSRGNMRHFLELCHQTLSVASRKQINIQHQTLPPMPIDIQSEASTNSSRLELVKVDELGKFGENLRFIVNRLGLFFQLIQKRKSQSETEVNHFSIKVSDVNELDATTKILLEEAVIWSVLIETEGDTKRKGSSDVASKEYMLHPMFSPHFGISFRRKKKFEFSEQQIKTILSGSEADYVELCTYFVKKWGVSITSVSQGQEDVSPAEAIQRGLWDC